MSAPTWGIEKISLNYFTDEIKVSKDKYSLLTGRVVFIMFYTGRETSNKTSEVKFYAREDFQVENLIKRHS